jgi:hypothetical protein
LCKASIVCRAHPVAHRNRPKTLAKPIELDER